MGCVCVCVCVCFFPFILDVNSVGCTSRGHTGGRSHRISPPPSFCGACPYFSREKDAAVPFPRRPWSRILCTDDLIVLHLLGIFICIICIIFYFLVRKNPSYRDFELTSQRVRRLRGYQLSYRGDRLVPYTFCPFYYTASLERWDRGVVLRLPVDIVYLMYRSKPMSGQ